MEISSSPADRKATDTMDPLLIKREGKAGCGGEADS